nr:MAG TPA: hypothetical protein [Caudoviricetes sp.]DAM08032.1 MAG TPA: hypothetical protein [Caudoviricetes sp.]
MYLVLVLVSNTIISRLRNKQFADNDGRLLREG